MPEIEVTLLICAEEPERVANRIAALTSAAGYRLVYQSPVLIHDYYLDTEDWAVRRAGMDLRIRKIDDTSLITLKGPPTSLGSGIIERLEIELPWSSQARARIMEELRSRGIEMVDLGADLAHSNPLPAMAALGLISLQHRENNRAIRNIVSAEAGGGPILAELVIDSVIYHLGRRNVGHHEVEIEAKSDGGIDVLQAVAEELLEECAPHLQTWEHSKSSTGLAVEKLLDQEDPATLLDARDNLKPAAYEMIHRLLTSEGG